MAQAEELRQILEEQRYRDGRQMSDDLFEIALDIFTVLSNEGPASIVTIANQINQDHALIRRFLRDWEDLDLIDSEPLGYTLTPNGEARVGDLVADRKVSVPEPAPELTDGVSLGWTYDLGHPVETAPVLTDDTVIVVGREQIHGVERKTGESRWTVSLDNIKATPAVDAGTVYVGDRDGQVATLDAADGEIKWTYDASGGIETSPVVINDMVVVACEDNLIRAIDRDSGNTHWRHEVDSDSLDHDGLVTSVAAANDSVVFTALDGTLTALEASSGLERWTYDVAGSNTNTVTLTGHSAIVGGMGTRATADGYVCAVDLESGTHNWTFEGDASISTTPTVADGSVFVADDNSFVYALDEHSGNQQWKTSAAIVKGAIYGVKGATSPVVADGIVYVGSRFENAYALDASSGELLWVFQTDASTTTPTVTDGTVYVGECAISNTLFALNSSVSVDNGSPTGEEPASAAGESASTSCPSCDAALQGDENFCPECGLDLSSTCSSCDEDLTGDETFCPACGTQL